MAPELTAIVGDDFQAALGLVATVSALHRALARSPQVTDLRRALQRGQIEDHELRTFVNTLLQSWVSQRLFPHDVTLAALAVVLERWHTDFAEEYLHDLARLDAPELPKSTRIARQCLATRTDVTASKMRRFIVAPNDAGQSDWRMLESVEEQDVGEINCRFQFTEAVCRN